MGFPKIFHDNRLDATTPVASTTATGFDVLNLADWRPYTEWRPTALPALVTGDAASLAWEFTNTADGWTGSNVTLTNNATYINILHTSDASTFLSPSGLTVSGAENRYIVARLRRNAGAGWDGTAYYKTSRHSNSASYRSAIADPTSTGFWKLAIWDMHNLTAGGDDWKNSIITDLRLDLGNNTDDFDVDWIGVFPSLSADYALVWGHDMGTQGVTLEVRGSVDGSNYTLVSTTDPEGDDPLLLEFASTQYRWWRFKIIAGVSSGNPTLGVASIGTALEIPQYPREGFDPVGSTPKGTFNKSVAGQPLGRTVSHEEWAESLTFQNLTWAWLRATWEPAWDAHLRGEPFVFAWDAAGHATELVLVTVKSGFRAPHKAGSYNDLTLDLVGLRS